MPTALPLKPLLVQALRPRLIFMVVVLAVLLVLTYSAYVQRNKSLQAKRLEEALQKIDDSDPAMRREAAHALGEVGNPEGIEPLLEALRKDEDANIRADAAKALGKIGYRQVIRPALDMLHKAAGDIALAITANLRTIRDTGVLDSLCTALQEDKEAGVRRAAVEALSKIHDALEIKCLATVVRGKDARNDADIQAALRALSDGSIVETLLTALSAEEDPGVRCGVVDALGRIADARAVKPLATLLESHDRRLSGAAGYALQRIGEPAVEALMTALNYDDSKVRLAAVETLGKIGDRKPVAALVAMLEGEDRHVRYAAARALGEIGDSSAVAPLCQALRDSDRDMRMIVADALGRLRDPRAVEALTATTKDRDPFVGSAGARALAAIGNERGVAALVAGLKDEKTNVRRASVEALTEVGKPAVDPLVGVLKDKDAEVRRLAAEGLGRIRDSQAVQPLIAMLEDKSSKVRGAAASALGEIGEASAVPSLCRMLKDEDEDVRMRAANTLYVMGDERAVEGLVEALKDSNYFVKHAAAAGLLRITKQDFGMDYEKWKEWVEKNR